MNKEMLESEQAPSAPDYEESTTPDEAIISSVMVEPAVIEAPVAMQAVRTTNSHVPTGKWKDGFWNCFAMGLCHQSCFIPFCCPLSKCSFQVEKSIYNENSKM